MATLTTSEQRIIDRSRDLLSPLGIDTTAGSPVDSLLVRPGALLADDIISSAATAADLVQFRAIANGTVVVDDDEFDQVVAGLGVERRQDLLAYGEVDFVLSSATAFTIPAGVRLTSTLTGAVFYTDVATAVVPLSAGGAESTSRKFIVQTAAPGPGSYRVRVSVTASTTGPTAVLLAGDELSLNTSFSTVLSVVAAENFSGGTLGETNAQLASRLLGSLVKPSLNSSAAASALVASMVSTASAQAVGPSSPLLTRVGGGLLGINPAGYADLWVKTGALAYTVIPVEVEVVDEASRNGVVTITPEMATGVYSARVIPFSSTVPVGPLAGEIQENSKTYTLGANSGYTPVVSNALDIPYGANANIAIDITDTRTAGGVPTNTWSGPTVFGEYAVEIAYAPNFSSLAESIYGGGYIPLGADVYLRAGIPVSVTATVSLRLNAGQVLTQDTAQAVVASAINSLPIGTKSLSTFSLASAISAYTSAAQVLSLSVRGTAELPDGSTHALTSTGGALTIPTIVAKRLGPESAYFIVRDRADVEVVFVD